MKKLSIEQRARIIACLTDGVGVRATARITGFAQNTVLKFVADIGAVASQFQEHHLRGLDCQQIQLDEIWAFCGAKQKNATPEQQAQGWGDIWTWVAIDPETKLIPCWLTGARSANSARQFVTQLRRCVLGSPQITSDGYRPYIAAIVDAFGSHVHYAQLEKVYAATPEIVRYSPAPVVALNKNPFVGLPDPDAVSTSHVERQNLTMRMQMRRFTRLTNGFSKKLANHEAATALHFFVYNFCTRHGTLKTTPAIAAGVVKRQWSHADLADLLDVRERLVA